MSDATTPPDGDDVDGLLRAAVRASGELWLLGLLPDERASLRAVRRRLDAAYAAHADRYPDLLPGEAAFDDATLLAEASDNPHKARAIFQALGASSPDIVALVWRVLDGDAIAAIDLHYRQEDAFTLDVELVGTLTGRATRFRSTEIEDATLLRHLGIMRMGDKPLFDGYYALDLTTPHR